MTETISPWLSSLPRYLESVFMMTITTKTKELTEASASVGLLLATTPLVWDTYVADSLKRSGREKISSGQCRRKVIPSTRIPTDWTWLLRVDQNKDELFKFLVNKVTTITIWCHVYYNLVNRSLNIIAISLIVAATITVRGTRAVTLTGTVTVTVVVIVIIRANLGGL